MVSIEPGESGAPHEAAAVLRGGSGVVGAAEEGSGGDGGPADGRNLVRREFFERHR